MPLGLLSLAACLQKSGIKVKIYKPGIYLISDDDFKSSAADILSYKPGLIGFSTWCITYPASLLIAKEIKNQSPEIPIVFGGPHASVLAGETLKNFPFIDFVLKGEADTSFPQFVQELTQPAPNFSCIPGLCFRTDSGQIKENEINKNVINLDELPLPAYNLVPQLKWMKLDVGRGCPFQCIFCSTSDFFSKKYRVKSSGKIIGEMMKAFQNKGIKSYSFSHDMFTLNKKFVFELCDKLIALKTKGIVFKWTCSARIDCISEEMIIKMKEAGCSDIFFGIETGSQRMQQIIRKNLDVADTYKIADLCRIYGINMHASFIIGFPEETKTDVSKTLKCALLLAIKGTLTQISELTLLPGTPIYESHFEKLKFDGNFSNFSRNFCGDEETALIKMYPEIFSSFFYLPVKTIARAEMLFLRFFINQSKHFRNTLFLLSELIEHDIGKTNLLEIYKTEFKRIAAKKEDQGAVALHWIKAIDNYIIKNSERIKIPYINDVFACEAYASLLLTLYSTWQLIDRPTGTFRQPDKNFFIKPTPLWKIITVSHKLEKIIPSENKWKTGTISSRKGKYHYLLMAVSTNRCRRIKISKKEHFMMNNLAELSFSDYVEKVELVCNEKDAFNWLKKLRKRGVVEFF